MANTLRNKPSGLPIPNGTNRAAELFHVAWVAGYVDDGESPPKPQRLGEAEFTHRVTECLNKALALDYQLDFSDVEVASTAVKGRLAELKGCLRGVWFQPEAFLRRFRCHVSPPNPVLELAANSYHELAIGIATMLWHVAHNTPQAIGNLSAFLEEVRLACPDLATFYCFLEEESVKAERLPAAPTPEPAPDPNSGDSGVTAITTHVTTKRKRSTERGEGRVKLIAALTKHHKYADGGCLNLEPIGNNELARLAEVSISTASGFLANKFDGHAKYRAVCGDATQLIASLKLLNQEFSPYHLFGRKPPDERDRDTES